MQIEKMKASTGWCESKNDLSQFFRHQGLFFNDLKDELNAMEENTRIMATKRHHLVEAMQRASEERMNSTLYILTLATVLILPLQLMSSIYGMNFQGEHGNAMPELGWKHAYIYFWTVVGGLTLLLVGVMKAVNFL